ncbi:Fic family protein [Holosporaceae bacterium 'Namur']|nr:Fic family protein [Holosporaceae bacterium 'Namur']
MKSFSEQEHEAIHRYARISMIGASTRIENAVLTDQEIDWIDTILGKDGKVTEFNKNKVLIEDKLSKDRERSIEEVAGCREMLFLIYEQAKELFPLTEVTLRGLHFELMKYYSKAGSYIGKYKAQPNYVVEHNKRTKEQRIVFKTAEAGPITESAVSDLINWYNQAVITEPWSIALACEFVFRFLAIHPFQDGNGRLGRGLFLLALLQSPDELISYVAPYLAIDRHIEQHKIEYYMVLNRCSNGVYSNDPRDYKIEYFLIFMIKVLEESLNDISFYRNKYLSINTLSDAAIKVLNCFKENPELRLSTKLILSETELPRRTIVNALNTLLSEKLIQKYGKGASIKYQLTF